MTNNSYPIHFPAQKKSTNSKDLNGKDWYKQCVESAEGMALYYEMESHRKMDVWENLYNGLIDVQEIEKVFNPMELEYAAFPAATKNYPIAVPKIDLLIGEELKRRFDWVIRSRSMDVDSNSNSDVMEMFMDILIEEIQNAGYDEEKMQQRIQEFGKYAKYDWKDAHELMATRIMQYLWRQQDLQDKFNRSFKNAIVMRREVFRVEDVGGEPSAIRCDPRNVYVLRQGDSEKIEDADIIVEITYEPVGKVIDSFYDYLTPDEIDSLESGTMRTKAGTNLGYSHMAPPIYSNLDFGNGPGFIDINEFSQMNFRMGMPYDDEGNVRVVRVRWVGRKKVGKLTYFDDNGDEQERLVSEYYKPNKDLGEMVKWIWINEAYEGTRIGKDIFTKLEPRKIQMRHFDNKSKCFLGYVGTDYGTSLMERLEPYQYLYNTYMRRLELLMAKYKGPIYELDLNKIPDDWDLDKWMYYAEVLGWAPIDNFNEAKTGAAQGKIAGSFNTTGKVLDANAGNIIQQTIMYLQFLEDQMGKIAGVTDQRQGQISNRETVGGVERSVVQSSHITERWFFVHDETKRRVMNALLDTAKYVWKDKKSKKINFVLDDMSRAFLEFNTFDFASTEYDLFTSSSSKDLETRQVIQSLIQPAIQNGASLKLAIDVSRADSLTQMAKMIEQAEDDAHQRQQSMQQQQQESNERIAQMQEQSKQADRDLKRYEIDTRANTELEKARMANENSIDVSKIDKAALDQQRLDLDRQKHSNDVSIKDRQLNEIQRHNMETESISRSKPKTNK